MEQRSNARRTIRSSPKADGARREPWQWVRVFSAVKKCPTCGTEFRPKIYRDARGNPIKCEVESLWNRHVYCSQECQWKGRRKPKPPKPPKPDRQPNLSTWKEQAKTAKKICPCCGTEFRPRFYGERPVGRGLWNRQRFCSIRCAKLTENPAFENADRKSGWIPQRKKGGNGRGMPESQKRMLEILSDLAVAELPIVTTTEQRECGLPHALKPDVAIPSLKLAVELDGKSHRCFKVRDADKRKNLALVELGWSVLRLSNSRALWLCSTCKSREALLTSLTAFSSTTAI